MQALAKQAHLTGVAHSPRNVVCLERVNGRMNPAAHGCVSGWRVQAMPAHHGLRCYMLQHGLRQRMPCRPGPGMRPVQPAYFLPEKAADMGSGACSATGSGGLKTVLVIGATGVTGKSAVEGLLQSQGEAPGQLRLLALTRNASSPAAAALRARSIDTITGDLDDTAGLTAALAGVSMVYCHALSSDAAKADPAEVRRAEHLAQAMAAAGVQHVLYNSSAGRDCGYGISQMEQKHHVEDILTASGVPLTALRATMFMEEFWKRYTRPQIITKGSFPFSLPPDKKLQLLAARDMGLVAGRIMLSPEQWASKAIDLAGDELTPVEMAAAFTRAQPAGCPTPVRHYVYPSWVFWILNKDLYRITRFLSEKGYSADVKAVRLQFPGMMTFEQCLAATNWQDGTRTYEQGIVYDGVRTTAPVA